MHYWSDKHTSAQSFKLKFPPNRGPKGLQTRFLMCSRDRLSKRRFLQAFFLHYQHCEDAIWLWKTTCFEGFSLCRSCRFCLSSYHAETSKLASKSVSKVIQNRSRTVFEVTCVLETLPGRVWNDFRLPNGLPKEVLEASLRPSKTSSLSLGLLGGLQNGFWEPFGSLGAGFYIIFGCIFRVKIYFDLCVSLQFCIVCHRASNGANLSHWYPFEMSFLQAWASLTEG